MTDIDAKQQIELFKQYLVDKITDRFQERLETTPEELKKEGFEE